MLSFFRIHGEHKGLSTHREKPPCHKESTRELYNQSVKDTVAHLPDVLHKASIYPTTHPKSKYLEKQGLRDTVGKNNQSHKQFVYKHKIK